MTDHLDIDALGLYIDMTDADRLRQWATNLATYGPDVTHWASTVFVSEWLKQLAGRVEKTVRDDGTLLARLRAAEYVWTELSVIVSCSSPDGHAELDQALYAYQRAREAVAERDALQARVTELEAAVSDPTLAVDLAAFLNLTGEAVAEALAAAGCRLEVTRDPSAGTRLEFAQDRQERG